MGGGGAAFSTWIKPRHGAGKYAFYFHTSPCAPSARLPAQSYVSARGSTWPLNSKPRSRPGHGHTHNFFLAFFTGTVSSCLHFMSHLGRLCFPADLYNQIAVMLLQAGLLSSRWTRGPLVIILTRVPCTSPARLFVVWTHKVKRNR